MPAYSYRCPSCLSEHDRLYPIGEAPRHQTCNCGQPAELVIGRAVQIAPSALETKGQNARELNKTEQQWNADMPAYYRMRKRGLQPKQIDGAAQLENKVDDQRGIDYEKLIDTGVTPDRITEGMEQAAEIGA